MSQYTLTVLDELDDLIPAERNKSLINLWLSHPDAEQRSVIKAELDSRLATFSIIPQDYALVLRASQSIPWALDALKNHKEKKIVTVAIDVLQSIWNKDPKAFLNGAGDYEGIIDLINEGLPQIYVVRLFRAFGRPRPLLPDHVTIVDTIFRAIFPVFGSSTPLYRYARIAVNHVLTAASLDVVRVVLHGWSTKLVHESTWTKLALRRPDIFKEILLGQFQGLRSSPTTGRLDDPSHIFPLIVPLLTHERDSKFMDQFLAAYNSYLSRNSDLQIADPVIANLHTESLLDITAAILRREAKIEDLITRVISLCNLLKIVLTRYGEENLYWYETDGVFSLLCEEFGRSRWVNHWTVSSPKDLMGLSGSATAVGLLIAVFRLLPYDADVFTRRGIIQSLAVLPRKARFPVCHIFHVVKTGESLAEDPAQKSSFPEFSPGLLALLHPTHGRLLLEVGLRSKGDNFISTNWLDAINKLDTQSLLLASWVGAERGFSGELGSADEGRVGACTTQAYIFKANASRSQDASGRLYNIKMALLTCKLAHSPSLFDNILSWAFNRYAKDVETGGLLFDYVVQNGYRNFDTFLAGPLGLYVTIATRKTFSKEALSAWCAKGVDALKSIFNIFRVWIKEPNHGQSAYVQIKDQYKKLCDFYFKVIEARINLIEKIYPTLSDNLDELRVILLDPMTDLFMEWENFKVIENPEPLQFNITNPSPQKLQSHLQITRHVSSVVLRFLVELGRKREELYREGRRSITSVDESVLMQRWNNTHYGNEHDHSILPCGLVITKSKIHMTGVASQSVYKESQKRHLYRSIDLSDGLGEYVESVLFEDLDATLDSLQDRLDWDRYQFPEALHTYLRASVDRNDMVGRLMKLFDLYQNIKAENGENLVLILLQAPLVRRIISQDATLFTKVVGSWLPQYPPSDQPLGLVTFNFFDLMPNIPWVDVLGMKTLVKAMQNPRILYNDDRLKYFCGLFGGTTSRTSKVDLPIHMARRVTVLAVAWIMSILKIPTDVAIETEDIEDPISYAIRHVRVDDKILNIDSPGASGTLLLSRVMRTLSPGQISLLLRVVFTAEMVEKNLTVMMRIMKMARWRCLPGLPVDQIWQVVKLPQMSSWHRMALTTTLLRYQDPPGAKNLIKEFLMFSKEGQESRKLSVPGKEDPGRQTMEVDDEKGMEEAKENEAEAVQRVEKGREKPGKFGGASNFLKISTESMVIGLLRGAFEDGIISFDDIESFAETNMLAVSPSIVSVVSEFLVEVVTQTWLLYGDGRVGVWDLLKPYIEIAQRVSEVQDVTDEQWKAARAGSIPMPEVVQQYPVADSLLPIWMEDLPLMLRRAWTVNVIEPLLVGHVNSRTEWLKAAVAREGGSPELEAVIVATYSPSIKFATIYRIFAPWFTYERTGDQEPIIDIIKSRVAPSFARAACQTLLDIVGQNHSGFWRGTVYGRAVISMTEYATRDHSGDGRTALEVALLSPISSGDVTPSWLVGRISWTLTTIAADLLRPENIMFDPTQNPETICPLDAFTMFFQSHLTTERRESKLIRELCSKYLEEAREQEQMKSLQSLNGGAAYRKSVVEMMLVVSFSHDTMEGLARALAEVVSVVTSGWYSCVHLPEIVAEVFQFPLHHIRSIGLVRFVDVFTQPPYCPNELGFARTLTFQTALAVFRANKAALDVNPPAKRDLEQLIERWKTHEDGAVQWLAYTFKS